MHTADVDGFDLERVYARVVSFVPKLVLRVARQATDQGLFFHIMIVKVASDLLGALGAVTFGHAEV